jgi:tetratricopeptide (TPR) repeat protein
MRTLFLYIFFCSGLISRSQSVFLTVKQSMERADFTRASQVLDSCLSKQYKQDSALFYKTLVGLKTGQTKNARKTYNTLFKSYPNCKELHYLNGLIYFAEEDYGRSIDEFNRALKKDPKNVKLIYNRSLAFGMLDEYLTAIEDLGTCIQMDSTYVLAYYSRAYWYEYTGNYAGAVKDYETTVRLNPASYDAYLGLANVYKNLNEMTKACEAINKAVKEGSLAAVDLKDNFCKENR